MIHNEKDKSWLTKKNCIKKKNTHRRDKKNILKRVIKTRYFPWICIKLSLRWMKSHKKRTDDLLESVGWFYMLIPIFRLKEASLFYLDILRVKDFFKFQIPIWFIICRGWKWLTSCYKVSLLTVKYLWDNVEQLMNCNRVSDLRGNLS